MKNHAFGEFDPLREPLVWARNAPVFRLADYHDRVRLRIDPAQQENVHRTSALERGDAGLLEGIHDDVDRAAASGGAGKAADGRDEKGHHDGNDPDDNEHLKKAEGAVVRARAIRERVHTQTIDPSARCPQRGNCDNFVTQFITRSFQATYKLAFGRTFYPVWTLHGHNEA